MGHGQTAPDHRRGRALIDFGKFPGSPGYRRLMAHPNQLTGAPLRGEELLPRLLVIGFFFQYEKPTP
jgi:hypothetical protein